MKTTAADALLHLTDYLGAGASDLVLRDCKRAILEAYRDLGTAHRWTYLYSQGRIITSAPYSGAAHSATLAYDHAGGTYSRMATISGDTWPTWAAGAFLRPADGAAVAYRVAERKDATTLILDEVINPGADLPSGTDFLLYRDTYLLPSDFVAQDEALYERSFGGLKYTHPRDWLFENRYVVAEGTPQCFTIMGDPATPGRLAMRVFPWPAESLSLDFIYQRRPRALSLWSAKQGTASVAPGATSVTGSGTAFTPAMVGSVMRLAANATVPTSAIGANPPAHESAIVAYTSATSVTLADPAPVALTAVAQEVGDPVDVEQAMLNAFFRCCEMHVSMNRTLKDKPSARLQYQAALGSAKDADSRSFAARSEGTSGRYRPRLSDYPQGPDEP